MRWTLSEFLNLIELRGQCWCLVDFGAAGGFNVPHSEDLLFYACLEGRVRIDGVQGGGFSLQAGDIVLVLNGDAHAVRARRGNSTEVFEFLQGREYVDIPSEYSFRGRGAARLLCGCMRVRWPGAERPQFLPGKLLNNTSGSLASLRAIVDSADTPGAAAVLTRAASLFFTAAFRAHPECQRIFIASTRESPIRRARHFMEVHPFQHWTVEILATKVGMSRSSFAAHFVEETGQTPMDFLTGLRMGHALDLLQKTDMKISAIGEHVGYRSEAAFSRRFTRHFQQSPGRLRQQLQRETDNANQNKVGTAHLLSAAPARVETASASV